MEYRNSSKNEWTSATDNNMDEMMNVKNLREKTLHMLWCHFDTGQKQAKLNKLFRNASIYGKSVLFLMNGNAKFRRAVIFAGEVEINGGEPRY